MQQDGPLCTTICCYCFKILVRSLRPCDSPITTPNNTNNQSAKGARGTGQPTPLSVLELMKKDRDLKMSEESPGHQPRGWKHNKAPRTRNHRTLTLSVWLWIHSCQSQEGSRKPLWDSRPYRLWSRLDKIPTASLVLV